VKGGFVARGNRRFEGRSTALRSTSAHSECTQRNALRCVCIRLVASDT
jgi:hypothetical protein